MLPACQATNFTYQHFFAPDTPYRTVFETEEGHDIIEVTGSAAEPSVVEQGLCSWSPEDCFHGLLLLRETTQRDDTNPVGICKQRPAQSAEA